MNEKKLLSVITISVLYVVVDLSLFLKSNSTVGFLIFMKVQMFFLRLPILWNNYFLILKSSVSSSKQIFLEDKIVFKFENVSQLVFAL